MVQEKIATADAGATALRLEWSDGLRDRLPWLWLRDHCPCPACLHPETRQRLVETAALPADLTARTAALEEDGAALVVTWAPDGHRSRYPAAELRALLHREPPEVEPQLWDRTSLGNDLPAVEYQAVMSGDDGLRAWLQAVARLGFCFVRQVPAEPEATRRLAERIGYLRDSIFGAFWDFTADLAHGDTAYTNLEIGLHTDGTYTLDPPGLQLFHCLEFDGTGGESLLVDGFRAAAELARREPRAYQTLTRVRVPARYLEPGVELRAEHPILDLDPAGNLFRVCFNNYDRAPFAPPDAEIEPFYAGLRAFAAILADPAFQLRFTLRPGTVLLFDNWRVLHARTAYVGRRRLIGCYFNREDFESRLRVLRHALDQGGRQAAAG